MPKTGKNCAIGLTQIALLTCTFAYTAMRRRRCHVGGREFKSRTSRHETPGHRPILGGDFAFSGCPSSPRVHTVYGAAPEDVFSGLWAFFIALRKYRSILLKRNLFSSSFKPYTYEHTVATLARRNDYVLRKLWLTCIGNCEILP